MPKTVGVAVSNATFHFDKLYTYCLLYTSHLVALTKDNVEHSLRANDLAGGSDQRRIACILDVYKRQMRVMSRS